MSTLRSQLAGLVLLLALAFVLALGWLSWTGRVAAQQSGQKQKAAVKPAAKHGPIDAADVRVMKALNSLLRVKFENRPVIEVLDYLDDKTRGDLNIIIDELTIHKAAPDLLAAFLNDPVNIDRKKPVKIRTVLNLLLVPRNMGYYIDDGSIVITTSAKAKTKLIVKSYPVANLVGGKKLVDAAIQELQHSDGKGGPLGTMLGEKIDALTAEIIGSVEPEYWKTPAQPDAPGAMQFVPATASLQIRASLEVHYLLMASGLLDNSRKVDSVSFEEPDPKAVTVKAYDITGLIDPQNSEASKAELLSALNLAIVKEGKEAGQSSPPSLVILAYAKFLVARQTLENHRHISQLLGQMRGPRPGQQPGAGFVPNGMWYGGSGNLFDGRSGGVFGNNGGAPFNGQPGGTPGNPGVPNPPPPAGVGFLGDVK